MEPAPDVDTIVARERLVWEALLAGDADADATLLADDFVGVSPTGFATRNDHAELLSAGPTVADYSIVQPVLLAISADAALLAYEARYRRCGSDTLEGMYVSSLWCRRDGEWVNTFSQDTPIGDPVP